MNPDFMARRNWASAALYWGGEADLRVNGKKMELTSLPANEWAGVVKDAEKFWDDVAASSPRSGT